MILNVLHLTSPRAKRAFTLIETLVAITILTLAIVGPLYAANRAIVGARTSRDHLTATYLAQEAIEYVRLMRDDDFLARHQAGGSDVSATAWNDFISGSGAGSLARLSASTPTPTTQQPQSTSGYSCSANIYNCTDFSTHAEAQSVYEMCGGVSNDIHRLDQDKDGDACESLP